MNKKPILTIYKTDGGFCSEVVSDVFPTELISLLTAELISRLKEVGLPKQAAKDVIDKVWDRVDAEEVEE